MGLEEFFVSLRHVQGHEFDKLRRHVRADRSRRRRKLSAAEQRVEALEEALARVTMLARALAELCLAKGLVTRAELERALAEADLADGAEDGGLDPSVALPGEQKAADLEPLEPPRPPHQPVHPRRRRSRRGGDR